MKHFAPKSYLPSTFLPSTLFAIIVSLILTGFSLNTARAEVNSMHPAFPALDSNGRSFQQYLEQAEQTIESDKNNNTANESPEKDSHNKADNKLSQNINSFEFSHQKTCGACHDAEAIKNSAHSVGQHAEASCLTCHAKGGEIPIDPKSFDENGLLKREFITIGKPKNDNCASCHGLIHTSEKPLEYPDDFCKHPERYKMTNTTGQIVSPKPISASYLNIAGKQNLNQPWDVHASRMLKCVDCHYSGNSPFKNKKRKRFEASDR